MGHEANDLPMTTVFVSTAEIHSVDLFTKIYRKRGIWMHGFPMFSVSIVYVILLETIGYETDQNWSFPRLQFLAHQYGVNLSAGFPAG